ncbi:RNA polymerase sigma factor [Cytophagales bacterium LB-30]|uniref:RNA polymerase sigma factor n=1 Tax=Shiella aurantiaca TaxID=3058365 RepID=A0ABT8F7N8_9BACT|nr:RNA polymerase sigma factor [Shiella aurantiaca]MDN4166470.1 RNA polymerase sigma factor [Shiella aurantiaca]
MKLQIGKSKNEEELIQACLKGDRKAQKDLYTRYASKMMGVCVRYIKNRDDAEDVLISAFMKIFEKLHTFQMEGSFEGWIRRIMVNDCLMWIRKNKYMYVEVDADQAPADPNLTVLENHLHEEELLAMIQQLPEGYRTVFNLYVIEGYSHKEIADLLSINENTSKSQLSRARVYLQKQLAQLEKEITFNTNKNEPSTHRPTI